MNYTLVLIGLGGLLVGGITIWIVLRIKTSRALAEGKGLLQTQVATLTERVSARDQQLDMLQAVLQAEEDQKTQLSYDLQQQHVARAAAEEKTTRIPQLELEAQAREEQLALLRQEVTELKTTRSELLTTIEKERKSSADKLALLNEAQTKLSDAFKALAAEALQSNNQSFLTLATQN